MPTLSTRLCAGRAGFWLVAWLALPMALLAPRAAWAACSVVTAAMNFGSYTGAASTPGATTVQVTCPVGLLYAVGMTFGNNSGGTYQNWNMLGPSSTLLPYKVYSNAARTTLMGNMNGTDTQNGVGNGAAQSYSFYPAAAADTAVVPGTYTDTITWMVNSVQGTTTSTINVTAIVSAACVVSAAALNFGTYAGLAVTAATSLSVTCTNTTTYNVGVDNGQHSSGNYNWNMVGPSSNLLNYSIYQNMSRTQLWGAQIGTNTISGVGSGTAKPLSLYGYIPPNQLNILPGSYSDIVSLMVYY